MRRYGVHPVLENARGQWEYELVLRGDCFPTLEGKALRHLNPPALWVFPPDSRHGWSAPREDVSEIIVLHFERVPFQLSRSLIDPTANGISLDPSELPALLQEFASVETGYQRPDPSTPIAFARMNFSLALCYLRHRPPPFQESNTNHAHRKVTQAINWMRHHLTDAPSIERAAKAVGVSATHLRRLFHECLGTTPRVELEKMRLTAAEELIRNGRYSLAQISDLLGYSEPSAFSRAYKRHYQRPPSALKDLQ